MEILFSIKNGAFPLYHPTYALGQSSVVLTWSQVFHPISHLSSIMPGYWNGHALQWYTFFKLLSLGLTQLALFALLRKLSLNLTLSFLISLITVYNLRMLDLFRFGAALEAYTGYLLLCTAIAWYFISPATRDQPTMRWLAPVSIIITTYLLVVSGHPQHMYYGLLGAGLFFLVCPFFLSNILEQRITFNDASRFWLKTGFCMLLGILLASVYIFPFVFDFYTSNTGRADATYEWSTAPIGFFEMLGNFFMPFFTDVHSVFGGSSLLIIPLILPLLLCFKIKIPRSVWAVWGILLFAILFLLGETTPVYKLFWKDLPFLSAFRHQGRVAIIIPIFLMLLLVWILKNDSFSFGLKRFSLKLTPYSILALIAILLIPVYLCLTFLFKAYSVELPPIFAFNIPLWTVALVVFAGVMSLIGLVLYGMNRQTSRLPGIFLVLMTIFQICIIFRYGTFVTQLELQPTFNEMRAQKSDRLDFGYSEVINMHTSASIEQIRQSFLEPFFGKIFTQVIPVASQDEAYQRMIQERLPQQLFIEGYDLKKAGMITEETKSMRNGIVKLDYSSFNRMQFHVVSQSQAFFGFSYPYTGYWNAWVNGEKVHIYRANGAAHAVEIPEGESLVEFRYWSSAFFWGMLISCATFAVIGLFVCFHVSNKTLRIAGAVIILIISAGGFMLWYNSLYSGDNFETEYTWTYTAPTKNPNLAYGKKTSGYYPASEAQLRFHGSNAVDGDTKAGSGFRLGTHNKGLIVDLYENEAIKSIILYGHLNTEPEISLSIDGAQWQKVTLDDNGAVPLRIIFEKPRIARFVKVKSIGSELYIDELEVYGNKEEASFF